MPDVDHLLKQLEGQDVNAGGTDWPTLYSDVTRELERCRGQLRSLREHVLGIAGALEAVEGVDLTDAVADLREACR
jgi:hypothetical protein